MAFCFVGTSHTAAIDTVLSKVSSGMEDQGQECKKPLASAGMAQRDQAGFMEDEDDPMDALMKQNVLWPPELTMPLMGGSCGADQGGELVMMKKKRLSMEQVAYLERSFDMDNRLEPERKVQIAAELGLQPRQVSIWFQNRRARSKNKQLERDYLFLKSQYQEIVKQNEKLQAQVLLLTSQLEGMDCKVIDGDKDKGRGSKHKEDRKDIPGKHNEDHFEEVGSPASSSSITFSSSTSIRSFSPKPSASLTTTKTIEGITSTITTSTCSPPLFASTLESLNDLTEDYSFLFDNNVFITQWEDPTDTTTNTKL